MSSVNPFFLNQPSPLPVNEETEKRNLQLMRAQTPDAEFRFSLRMNPANNSRNLKSIFDGQKAYKSLVEFFRSHKLKSFDLAWDLIQSTPGYLTLLTTLKSVLNKEGFTLTTTIGTQVDEMINATQLASIASAVDRIHLVPSSNSYYGRNSSVVSRPPDQAFDSLELNEGKLLAMLASLNVSREKIVVGMALQTMVWKTAADDQLAHLQLEPYHESCGSFNRTWKMMPDQPSPFYHLAVSPEKDQWMIHVDPSTLDRRIRLLRHYGFAGIALYDYHHVIFALYFNTKHCLFIPISNFTGRFRWRLQHRK